MFVFVFFKQKTPYDMRISDWSSDVCSSDLLDLGNVPKVAGQHRCQIRPRPILTTALALAGNRLGKTTQQRKLDKIVANGRLLVALQLPREERSAERRVGKEGVRTWRYRWARYNYKKKNK